MATAFLLGGTGLVGTQILHHLRSASSIKTVDLIARRNPSPPLSAAHPDSKVTSFVEPDTEKWAAQVKSLTPTPEIYFCAFATTRGAAGGFEAQYKLEHDLNIELARAAKESGTKVFVLISATGASTTARVPYSRLKGDIEEHVKDLGFNTTIILRPGLITGQREESRPVEAVLRKIADFTGKFNKGLKNFWAQDASVIAGAAVATGLRAAKGDGLPEGLTEEAHGNGGGKVWVLGQADIVKIGEAWIKDNEASGKAPAA